jgi:hypothetical protein
LLTRAASARSGLSRARAVELVPPGAEGPGNIVFSTSNALFNNAGTFDVQCDKNMNVANVRLNNPQFQNRGTFEKTMGGLTSMTTVVSVG